ncbi:biotin--[acetyl-CoA-carboxylase] ligase [Microbacterium bovistercoris]|uniref:biotin--[biotin carboxyl-carrier protein] ligase n=1 Tax=Microbacterium bovistercoris TaxID=2293570 RepID=A0A371NWR4_9MICO|nr:biotin--[acetyl-CoA-carboxylase] ligase [Microbacterium bovistercoris]REJ07600.1 biotin--[acetyl-CoA-carboxylase] ligase [Microbacterium bovistercoris]
MDLPRAAAVAARLDFVPQSPSTNAELRAAAEGAPHLTVLLTDHQTAGRGRLDRTWITPPGSALAISVLLRELPADPAARGWVPLIAGLAMADAVGAQLPAHEVGVKWPNDVLVDERKICGILAEATPDAVIVGSGVNTAMTAAQLPVPTATSFAALGAVADADRLVADYVSGLDTWITALAADPASARVHDAVTARCLTIGRQVRVELPGGGELRGLAIRLDADGRLVVEADGAEHPVSAGDVVHVRPI